MADVMPDTISAPERIETVEPEVENVEETDAGEPERDSDKPWHVVLLDDNAHTYQYVIEMLNAIFGYDLFKAFKMAREVDKNKRVIVKTCHLEKAEAYQEQIHAYGPDWRIPGCKGSMSAVLEKAR